MSKETPRPAVRITNQFRKREAMVYDLRCEDIHLTIEITPRENADGLGEWRVEAHAREDAEKPSIGEPGATRDEALRAVARAWAAKGGSRGFPPLDWAAVSVAMLAVRAI
jgi:hypothetical protein